MTTPPAPAESGDRVTELMDSLLAGAAQLTTSDDWLRWLDVARRFHRYRTGVSGISEVNEWGVASSRSGRD